MQVAGTVNEYVNVYVAVAVCVYVYVSAYKNVRVCADG